MSFLKKSTPAFKSNLVTEWIPNSLSPSNSLSLPLPPISLSSPPPPSAQIIRNLLPLCLRCSPLAFDLSSALWCWLQVQAIETRQGRESVAAGVFLSPPTFHLYYTSCVYCSYVSILLFTFHSIIFTLRTSHVYCPYVSCLLFVRQIYSSYFLCLLFIRLMFTSHTPHVYFSYLSYLLLIRLMFILHTSQFNSLYVSDILCVYFLYVSSSLFCRYKMVQRH